MHVREIDQTTLTFNSLKVKIHKKKGTAHCKFSNDDEYMICKFDDDLDLWETLGEASEVNALVKGNLLPEFGGYPIVGGDSVCVVHDGALFP